MKPRVPFTSAPGNARHVLRAVRGCVHSTRYLIPQVAISVCCIRIELLELNCVSFLDSNWLINNASQTMVGWKGGGVLLMWRTSGRALTGDPRSHILDPGQKWPFWGTKGTKYRSQSVPEPSKRAVRSATALSTNGGSITFAPQLRTPFVGPFLPSHGVRITLPRRFQPPAIQSHGSNETVCLPLLGNYSSILQNVFDILP